MPYGKILPVTGGVLFGGILNSWILGLVAVMLILFIINAGKLFQGQKTINK